MNQFRNLTIKARLILALAVVVAIMVGLGVFALRTFDSLAEQTTELYDHPLRVSNAALRASLGVSKINAYMEDLTSPTPRLKEQEALTLIRQEEEAVYQNLDIVRDWVLGAEGQGIEREARGLFKEWAPIRSETLRLFALGDHQAAAAQRAKRAEPLIARLEQKLLELNGYARNKGVTFMSEATAVQQRARATTMAIVVACALLVAALLGLMLRSILQSISSLRATMSEIRSTGKFVKSDLSGRHEIADMAHHFNALIDVLKRQFWLRDGINNLNSELLGSPSYEQLMEKSISFVSRYVDACAGALYSHDEAKSSCQLRASFAFVEREHLSNSFRMGEGIVGQVAVERQPILLRNIRRSEAVGQSGTVSEPPRCIYALPLVYKDALHGVLEVASFQEIDEAQREFLDAAGAVISTSMYTLLQGKQIVELLATTQAANETLRVKSEQLNSANEEMTAANSELQSQADELQAQTDELRAQSTELERQQAQLQETDRLKSEFLSNMSHELRTPLNSVLALSQLMISRGVGKNAEQEQEYLRVIERNGRQLLSLINDILDLSKIESGRMDISITEFDPRALADRVVETVAPMARAKGLAVKIEGQLPASIRSDEEKVRQILLNLVSNAVKFTDRGSVELAISQQGAWIHFRVRDTGIGIAPKDLRYVFDEFRQVDGSTTRRHEGTGLGLSICQKLAGLIGGQIQVESTPAVGSSFTLSIPAAAVPANADRAASGAMMQKSASEAVPPESRQSAPTVLVVDDEEEVRKALRAHLEQGGFRVLTARDGTEAVELARQHRPSAITLDLMMPAMDGWEVITRLKASPKTAHIPVVIVSVTEDRATGAALGASGYVTKPVEPRALLAEIDKLAGDRRVRRVLVVDDDPGVREQVSTVLGERGYHVETASSGAEAIARVGQERPDAIILDLKMPEMDGFAVLDSLRAEPATSKLPVVVLTAKDLSPAERERLGNAAQQVITKGQADWTSLLSRLDGALGRVLDTQSTPRMRRGPGQKPLVLVVEDNPVATLQIRAALEDAGYDVDAASGGTAAIERVTAAIPDAVVLDLMMPEVDGFQVLEKLRSGADTAQMPVLVLTAKELNATDRANLARFRVQELVQKGNLDRDELVTRVGRLVAGPPLKKAPERDSKPARRVAKADGETGVVLLVEDNADNRFTISAILQELGCKHEVVVDGVQAVAAARRIIPSLILMDIQLPGLSGLDAARQIKADPATCDVPVVALTAKAMKGDRESILEAGCDDYLAKPIDPGALAAAVRRWTT